MREQRVALETNAATIKELRAELNGKDKEMQRLAAATSASSSSSSSSLPSPSSNSVSSEEVRQLQEKIARLEALDAQKNKESEEIQHENHNLKIQLSSLESKHNILTDKNQQMETSRSSTVASQAEHLAAVAKAERRAEELENEISELNDMIESRQ